MQKKRIAKLKYSSVSGFDTDGSARCFSSLKSDDYFDDELKTLSNSPVEIDVKKAKFA